MGEPLQRAILLPLWWGDCGRAPPCGKERAVWGRSPEAAAGRNLQWWFPMHTTMSKKVQRKTLDLAVTQERGPCCCCLPQEGSRKEKVLVHWMSSCDLRYRTIILAKHSTERCPIVEGKAQLALHLRQTCVLFANLLPFLFLFSLELVKKNWGDANCVCLHHNHVDPTTTTSPKQS